MQVDLAWDPNTMDIVCRRDPANAGVVHVNIPQRVRHHSPDGFEWGYYGSGPADFALNILDRFVPPGSDGREPVECWDGTTVSQTAWDLHQMFKRAIVGTLPRPGGTISGDVIRHWLAEAQGT